MRLLFRRKSSRPIDARMDIEVDSAGNKIIRLRPVRREGKDE